MQSQSHVVHLQFYPYREKMGKEAIYIYAFSFPISNIKIQYSAIFSNWNNDNPVGKAEYERYGFCRVKF